MNSILRITDPILKDDSIDRYEEIVYEPVTGANLNEPGQDIRLIIETQDIFTHPSESYLIIEGRLLRDNGNSYGNNDPVSITNNGMMYLFKRIRYDLSGQEIESLINPGQATTMLGLLKYPDDFSKSKGLNQLWYKDTTLNAEEVNIGWEVRRKQIIKNSDPKGTFSFKIPLKHIFGFCEDYDKVVYGLKHTLTITRNNNDDSIFRAVNDAAGNAVPAGKIELEHIYWFMPHVTPADKYKMELYKIIERKEKIPVGYRMIQCDSATIPRAIDFSWRLSVKSSPEIPRFIIVGFQTNKSGNQTTNPALFDNVRVNNIYVMLNSVRYPTADYNISFLSQRYSRVYGDATEFRAKFYNMDELISNPNITPADYKTMYPLFLFDVSKQSEKLKYSTTDIQIKCILTRQYLIILKPMLLSLVID